jgi:uncharacterized protein YlxW (UPF0749 family)
MRALRVLASWEEDVCRDRTWIRITAELNTAKARVAALQADLDQANQTIDDMRERGNK